MEDLFYKRLDNWWDFLFDETKYKFVVRVERPGRNIHASITFYHPWTNTVYVRFVANSPKEYFAGPVVGMFLDDITRYVHHYFPTNKKIECKVSFGNKVVNYEWDVDQRIRDRRLI